MSRRTPCKRRDFIRRLRQLGFDGPFSGTRHQYLIYGQHRLAVPSNEEYSPGQVKMLLAEVADVLGRQVTLEEWQDLA